MKQITEKRDQLERAGLDLGRARGKPKALPDGGRVQPFDRGAIFWSEATGAFSVHGPILDRYRELGGPGGSLGYPVSDPTRTDDGRAVHVDFQHGSLYVDRGHLELGVYEVGPTPVACELDAVGHGRWEVPTFGSGVVGVHAALLEGERVLFFTYRVEPGCPQWPAPYGESSVLDLGTGHLSTPSHGPGQMENLFCSGHALLPDGSLMVAGGEREDGVVRTNEAVKAIHVFHPGSETWEHVTDCARGRWYCSCSTLPDGKVLIIGGSVRVTWNGTSNTTFEIFDPATGGVSSEAPIPDATFASWSSYPFVFPVPGNKAVVHFGTRTRFLDLATGEFLGQTVHAADRPGRNGRTYGVQGTAVLLPLMPDSSPPYRARIMAIGGGGPGGPGGPTDVSGSTQATDSCEILDLGWKWRPWSPLQWAEALSEMSWSDWWSFDWFGEPSLRWKLTEPMPHPRVMPDAVLLPDGTVFVCNGSGAGKEGNAKDPVYEADVYDPQTGTWTTLCHSSVARLYHATALLLPDGSVLTAGTDCAWNPHPFNTSQLTVEIFRPPYFFDGDRPHIGAVPRRLSYGAEVEVPTDDAANVAAAAMIRCGSVTHSFNPDQRYVGLQVIGRTAGSVRLAVPTDRAVAPPGPYLVFLQTEDRVPSVGRYVLLGGPTRRLRRPPHVARRPRKPFPPDDRWKVPADIEIEHPEAIHAVTERLAQLEEQVARLASFVELRQRPLFGGHGAEPGHSDEPSVEGGHDIAGGGQAGGDAVVREDEADHHHEHGDAHHT